MGQLGVSVALDHPTSESVFALAVHAQFISEKEFQEGGKKPNKTRFFRLSLFFFCPSDLSAWDLQ